MNAVDLYHAQYVERRWAGTPVGEVLDRWQALGLAHAPEGAFQIRYRVDGRSWSEAWTMLARDLGERLGLLGALALLDSARHADDAPPFWPADRAYLWGWGTTCRDIACRVATEYDADAADLRRRADAAYDAFDSDGASDRAKGDAWLALEEQYNARIEYLLAVVSWITGGLAEEDAQVAAALAGAVTR